MPLRTTCSGRTLAWITVTCVPALATASATSARDGHCRKISVESRPTGTGTKLICATWSADIRLEPLDLRNAQFHKTIGQFQFPRPVVLAIAVAPRRRDAQRAFGPARRTQILRRRVAATQHGDEVADAAPQGVGQPGRIGMAGVVDP